MSDSEKEERIKEEGSEDEAVPVFDFGKKKKKPKKKEEKKEKKEKVEVDEEDEEETPVFDFGKKKPKKPKAPQEPEEKKSSQLSEDEKEVSKEQTDNKFYPYEFLARRIFSMINSSGEQEKVKVKMKPPVVYREGTKKTIWVNFPEICKIMNRSPEHVLSFLLAEVGTTGSIDGSGRFVIKGRFQPKHIENILRRYIREYVKCLTCESPETTLKRENRLLFMICGVCGSKRTVAPIKTGFQATTRAGRRAART